MWSRKEGMVSLEGFSKHGKGLEKTWNFLSLKT